MGDSGYQGMQKIHKNCLIIKKRKNKQFSIKETRKFNKKLAQKRVIIEGVIGKLKVFKIFSTCYRNRRRRFGLRMNLIAGLYNKMKG